MVAMSDPYRDGPLSRGVDWSAANIRRFREVEQSRSTARMSRVFLFEVEVDEMALRSGDRSYVDDLHNGLRRIFRGLAEQDRYDRGRALENVRR